VPTAETEIVSAAELASLFSDLERLPALVLAVSGGPDSTALMLLAARWRKPLKAGPKLIAVTVDHGLRKESKSEAAAVAKLARKLGLTHRTLRWTGRKPKTGLQQAARMARYRLLAEAARKAGAGAVLTAHTLDDQAETVLIRMSRGSGITGLGAMQRESVLSYPFPERGGSIARSAGGGKERLPLLRPFLDIPKTRLIATLRAAKIPFAEDPSNRDPRFTRARLRTLMPELAREGLDARRLSLLARRLKRADAAIEAAVDEAEADAAAEAKPGVIAFHAAIFAKLPAEVALRLLGRAIGRAGDEGPVELNKLEGLKADLVTAQKVGNVRFRRSLAGAIVTLAGARIIVEKAPPRRRTRP
jgi:tRNA(Ile)-lysidine synthase